MPVIASIPMKTLLSLLVLALWTHSTQGAVASLELHARHRQALPADTNQFDAVERTLRWDPKKTAIIVCDMWDQHWCKGATARVAELAPRMNEVLKAARGRGVLIIHAPSSTMKFYADFPQRKRAQQAPKVTPHPTLASGCL